MQERVALEELNTDLSLAKARVEKWAYTKMTTATQLREEHLARISDFKEQIGQLNTEQELLSQQVEELQARLATEHGKEEILRLELKATQSKAAALPESLNTLQAALGKETAELRRREAELAVKKPAVESDLTAVTQAIQLFEDRLAMTFRHPDEKSDELSIVFTCIDAAAPDREYTVGVMVIAQNKYAVTRCEPELVHIKRLLAELNTTSNFAKFVQAVRSGFRQLVQ